MPKKLLSSAAAPILVADRLLHWGNAVRLNRRVQRLTAAELAYRAAVSVATLKRIEAGDPGVSVSSFLCVFNALAMLDVVAPALPDHLLAAPDGRRVRHTRSERPDLDDIDWF